MARRFRRTRRSGGRRGGSRKTRWGWTNYQLDTALESSLNNGAEWITFWAKWPASMAPIGRSTIPNEEVLISNEPVDETLVRLIHEFNFLCLNPGSGGQATTTINACLAFINWDGGEYPSFYDFAVFDNQTSFNAPPNPLFQGDDQWIIRNPFSVVNEVTTFTVGPTSEFVESRGRRKLPAGHGILGVLAVANYLEDASTVLTVQGGGDVRYAVRSGFSI